ncbi:MAG: hypothetical protein K0R26_2125 [Bacteroidota bacterium]|jgi:hypothetical protein|nr:hypothetical protein [Bacteroidota bacterium]
MSTNERFFKEEYIPVLKKLKGNETGAWGVLSPQGMVEHMTDAFANAYGRIILPAQTPEAILPKVRAFALSETPFKENTKNVLMGEEPAPLRNQSIDDAILELEHEIKAFMDYYQSSPGSKNLNPFFGEFNYEEWLHLLHKHAVHHLKQFNLS